jgi:hypothetical protein
MFIHGPQRPMLLLCGDKDTAVKLTYLENLSNASRNEVTAYDRVNHIHIQISSELCHGGTDGRFPHDNHLEKESLRGEAAPRLGRDLAARLSRSH